MALEPKSVTPDGDVHNRPLWRRHFSIDSAEEATRTRREFIGGLTMAGGAMACGQAAKPYLVPSHSADTQWTKSRPFVLEKKLTELMDGEAHLFHYPDDRSPCLLIRLSDQEFVAYSQKCTHLACPVIPEVQQGEFHCPCHHGVFDMRTGEPLAGPPRSPLPRVQVKLSSDETLTVTGMEATH